jgi:DNA modification methylase
MPKLIIKNTLKTVSTEDNTRDKLETARDIDIQNVDGMQYLSTLDDNSVDLVLTDPPYIISRDTGMNAHYNAVKESEASGITYVKSEAEWTQYKKDNNIETDDKKENYRKYGTIYGKKYCVKTDYGDWDKDFTMEKLELFIAEYYKKLKKGGTLIMFFDLWKITPLKELMEKHKFKQLRFIEWIKTNPQPLNSGVNYLTNCREIALLGIKGAKPTFNSKYDNAVYNFPLQGGKDRFHPTQKSILLFEELIKKHSNEGDTIVDTFLGGGTTAIACKNTNRRFKGCEISKEYYDKVMKLVN